MALRPTANDLRIKRLAKSGAATLREQGKTQEADAVDFLLSPSGWPMLGRLRAGEGGSSLHPNLPIQMVATVRDEIKANVAKAAEKAARAGSDEVVSIPAEAEKALRAFLAGEFTPEQPARVARGAGQEKANLNVRVDAQLRKDAEDYGADNAAEFGWAPRASHIIAAWLIGKYTTPEKADKAE